MSLWLHPKNTLQIYSKIFCAHTHAHTHSVCHTLTSYCSPNCSRHGFKVHPEPLYRGRGSRGSHGSSDGLCVQGAGTLSTAVYDQRWLGIPPSWGVTAIPVKEWGAVQATGQTIVSVPFYSFRPSQINSNVWIKDWGVVWELCSLANMQNLVAGSSVTTRWRVKVCHDESKWEWPVGSINALWLQASCLS